MKIDLKQAEKEKTPPPKVAEKKPEIKERNGSLGKKEVKKEPARQISSEQLKFKEKEREK